ncbi:zinc-ribbon domain-containing protein [bacterium]|nr:zinc-ribbon domain-containing protein [bacterium]
MQNKIQCKLCGYKLDANSDYCDYCGEPILEDNLEVNQT